VKYKTFIISMACFLMILSNNCGTGEAQIGAERAVGTGAVVVKGSLESGNLTINMPQVMQESAAIKTIVPNVGGAQMRLQAMGKVLTPKKARALVGFSCPARIRTIHKTLGNMVRKGDVLLTLECREVGDLLSEYIEAFEESELASRDLEREEGLYKKDIGSKKEILQARARAKIAVSQFNALKEKLRLMGFSPRELAHIGKTRSVIPRISLKAPIGGRIIKNDALIGGMIDPAQPVMEIADLGRLLVEAHIFENDLALVRMGQAVQVSVPAYPGEIFPAKLHYIGDVVEQETRTIAIRAELYNRDNKLKPGMFAGFDIQVAKREKALLVPKKAVLDLGDKRILFVNLGGEFSCREVVVGYEHNGDLEILSGLKPGERVVVEGHYQLKSIMAGDKPASAHVH